MKPIVEIIKEELQNYFNENFWQWFGNSKVVDKKGRPLKVYHGTTSDFGEFKSVRGMYYFSVKPTYAGQFAMNNYLRKHHGGDFTPSIMPVYLSIQNPLDLTGLGNTEMPASDFIEYLKEKGVRLFYDDIQYFKHDRLKPWGWIGNNYHKILPAIKSNGFDGIIMYEDTAKPDLRGYGRNIESMVYAVFEPQQIKSASGNNGEFSPSNPDITKEELEINKNDNISAHKTVFHDVPQDLYIHFRQTRFSDDANKSHMKTFRAKDQREFLIKKTINEDIFRVFDFQNLQNPIAIAVFDVHPQYFSGYEHRQSIEVQPMYRRIGIATAITDFAENIYGVPYKPTNLQTPEMQAFTKNRQGNLSEKLNSGKKLYYHGREQGKRPYSGNYIFITDNLGYAAGYSDGNELYTYTIPFDENRLFSIKNSKHLQLLSKYVDREVINAVIRDSGPREEIDWAALSYIGTDEFEMPEDLLQHLGFLGVRLKERQDIDSIYVFDQKNLKFEGTVDITTPEKIKQIGDFYREFTKDKNFMEGVADKYAEKAFNIPDQNRIAGVHAGNAADISDDNKPLRIYSGDKNNPNTYVYKNPMNLRGFEGGARAIADEDGNLYVAKTEDFNTHGEMGVKLGLVGTSMSIYTPKYLLLHVEQEDSFILSDSSQSYFDDDSRYYEDYLNIIKKIESKFPYHIITDDPR